MMAGVLVHERAPLGGTAAAPDRAVRAGGASLAHLRVLLRVAVISAGLGLLLATPLIASADPGDLGYQGPDGTGAGAAPSGSKPQAKLWFNDGIWWASMWDVGTSDFYIWKLDRSTETWSRTATRLDDRSSTRADVLWDGTKLYVASHTFSESDGSGLSRLYRYSYNTSTDTYSLDTGFPATINSVRSETLVIDKDSTGKLWATWEQGGRIWVNRTTGSDDTWGTPFILPGSATVGSDDISTLIAFGGNKLGVMYSNQNGSPDADQFVIHTDGQADTTWAAPETAVSGSGVADDHLNLKTDASGRVYAAVKTSLSGSSPLIKFLVRATNGSWSNYDVATGTDSHTRPILIVDEEHSLFRIYMTKGQSGGPIVEKTSPINAISWATGTGTPVIWDASANDMNNPSSTKQNVTAASGLIVIAFEDTTKHYWHGDIFGGGGADTTPPTVTTRVPSPSATGVATGTNVTATFSEAVTGVSGTTFTLEGPGATAVPATVSYDGATKTATLDPNATLAANTTYTARLTSGITDLATNPLAALNWSFTTAAADTTAPTVSGRSPTSGATGVATGTNVTATFSEAVTGVSGTTFTLEGPGATAVPATVSYDGATKTATLDPNATLAANTTYTARLTSGITDLATNPLAPDSWTFTTGAAPSGPVFRAASSADNVTATTLVVSKPAGTTSGDVLLASVSARGNPSFTAPAGWSLVRLDISGSTIRQVVFMHVAGASEPASYTFTMSKSSSAAGGIVAYSGVDAADPIDTHGGQANTSSTSITAPSISTTGSNRMLVGFFGTAVLTSETAPASMTLRFDEAVPSTNKYKITDGAADELLASGGATGPRIALGANSGISIGQLIALNPGGAPPVDTTAPTVTGRSPAVDATDIAIGTNVTATFSEDVTGVSGTTFTLEGPGATAVAATVSYNASTRVATLDPSASLAAGTTYTARLTSGITDLATNPLAPVSWSFTTAAADTTAPTVTGRSPAVDATDIAIGTNVTATFSEDVTGVSGTTFTLEGPGATAVAATVSYNASTRVATLDPSASLAAGTTYTARLTSGITDLATNPLAPVSWSFTTAAPSGSGIAFRSASSGDNTTATSLVIPAPAGVASADVLLAAVSVRGGPTITPPGGWTLVRQDINGSTMRQALFVHVAGASEPSSYTFTLSNAQSAAGGIVAYSGVDTADPIDVHGGQLNASSTSITAPSITTTGPDRMLVGFFGTPTLSSMTPPPGMTERYDEAVPSTNTYKVTSGAADGDAASAGATGTRVAIAANSAANIGQLVALRPAP